MMINQESLQSISKRAIVHCLVALLFMGCSKDENTLFSNPKASETGIDFINRITETDSLNILDYLYFYNGGGVAVGDVNNDGLPDIYFSGNQVKNKLYLNKGNLKFDDITETAGVGGNSSWNTSAIMGDINGDGLLDIYTCAVVGINGFSGHNELYINNGVSSNGLVTFTESAAQFNLDFDTYSSSAAFLDYDLDGDLDIYLLNHAVHTQESFGKAELRNKRSHKTGDRLLRNDNGKFTDVSKEAGIYGGVNGYGLGIAISDFNNDGYPDIYIGNDFHEDDYYYLNNKNGTFTESLKTYFGHTSRFSMGNDVADINHDGWPDLISLDMLPEDEKTLKSTEGDDNVQIQKLRIENYGYHYQFTRNMMYVNQQDSGFMETALMSGIAATDWSWSSLFGDYDQDGKQDLFVSNGIPKRPNDLDFINFASNEQIQKQLGNTKLVDQKALDMMPSGKVTNKVYRGLDNLKFQDITEKWIDSKPSISGATAVGDLDNDGDLDLVVNNINSEARLYINTSNSDSTNYLKIRFRYTDANINGIGTKVFAYHDGKQQYKEMYYARGFQASSEPMVHFGFGTIETVDSLKIIWPDKTYQVLSKIATDHTLIISPENTRPFDYSSLKKETKQLFKRVDDNLGLNYTHVEDPYLDFNRQKLIPYRISDRGPATAVGDLDGDGKEDIVFGGSKRVAAKLFMQAGSSFTERNIPEIKNDSITEDVCAIISDFNNDNRNDLFIGSGGGDFYNEMEPLKDRYYTNASAGFSKAELPIYFNNTSVIAANDFDSDKDTDVFIGSNAITNDFGRIPNSYLLKNNNGAFSVQDVEGLTDAGMITDAIWSDYNGDGTDDLIVVGEWMTPGFFRNDEGQLSKDSSIQVNIKGLWQKIIQFDIDQDSDMDYLLGNWGTNSKFKASQVHPMRMYYADVDDNGATETIVCTYKDGDYYPILSFNELAGQIVSIKKKFNTYKEFAGTPIDQLFESNVLKEAKVLEVNELRSGYLRNDDGTFQFIPFGNYMQVSPITAFTKGDFDGDSRIEVLAAGNYFGVTPFHGRFDAFPGALISNENNMQLTHDIGLDLSNKAVRHLRTINVDDKQYLVVTINNNSAEVYEIKN